MTTRRTRIKRWANKALLALTFLSIEAFFAVLVLLAGIPILIDPASLSPASVLNALPGWEIYLWAGGLVLGGGLTLAGIVIRDKRVERAGVAALAATPFVLGISIWFLAGFSVFLPILTYMLFAVAMTARYWVLGQEIKISRQSTGGGAEVKWSQQP